MLRRFFHAWEQSIFNADAEDRREQEFGWGVEHLDGLVSGPSAGSRAADMLPNVAEQLCVASDDFYEAPPMSGVRFDGHRLRFDSPLPSVDSEVCRASARMFESPDANGRAVVVVPQWNADEDSLVQACKILNRFGLSALRLTLPYHEERRPPSMVRADAMVSPVLGLTLQSVRRAVIEVRQAVGWLLEQGYRRVGIFGTSLGSCIGFLALTHEERVAAGAFNHVAGYFADVVWSGLATAHVRASLDGHVDLATLRRCWSPISPARFTARLAAARPGVLLVSGAYDPIFLPEHSQALVDSLRESGVDFKRVVLPCGHYTLGRPPFYLIDAYLVVRFFHRHLRT